MNLDGFGLNLRGCRAGVPPPRSPGNLAVSTRASGRILDARSFGARCEVERSRQSPRVLGSRSPRPPFSWLTGCLPEPQPEGCTKVRGPRSAAPHARGLRGPRPSRASAGLRRPLPPLPRAPRAAVAPGREAEQDCRTEARRSLSEPLDGPGRVGAGPVRSIHRDVYRLFRSVFRLTTENGTRPRPPRAACGAVATPVGNGVSLGVSIARSRECLASEMTPRAQYRRRRDGFVGGARLHEAVRIGTDGGTPQPDRGFASSLRAPYRYGARSLLRSRCGRWQWREPQSGGFE